MMYTLVSTTGCSQINVKAWWASARRYRFLDREIKFRHVPRFQSCCEPFLKLKEWEFYERSNSAFTFVVGRELISSWRETNKFFRSKIYVELRDPYPIRMIYSIWKVLCIISKVKSRFENYPAPLGGGGFFNSKKNEIGLHLRPRNILKRATLNYSEKEGQVLNTRT